MKSLTGVLLSLLILVTLSGVSAAQTNSNTGGVGSGANSNTASSSDTTAPNGNLTSDKKSFLKNRIDHDSVEFSSFAKRWSFGYHLFLFGGVIFAALAALLAKITFLSDKSRQDSLVAILAGLATLLPLISTTGDFSSKWQANRIAASNMGNLQLEVEKENANYDGILTRIQEIKTSRDATIAGTR